MYVCVALVLIHVLGMDVVGTDAGAGPWSAVAAINHLIPRLALAHAPRTGDGDIFTRASCSYGAYLLSLAAGRYD